LLVINYTLDGVRPYLANGNTHTSCACTRHFYMRISKIDRHCYQLQTTLNTAMLPN